MTDPSPPPPETGPELDDARPASGTRIIQNSAARRVGLAVGVVVLVVAAAALGVTTMRDDATPFFVPEAPPAAAYVPPPGEQTGPAPAPHIARPREGFDPDVSRPAWIASGRTGFNDRELILTLDGTGNRPMTGPDDGCKPEVRATVVGDEPDRVVVDVQGHAVEPTGARLPGRPAERVCTAEYPMGTVVVHLPTPLAGRKVVDANADAVPKPIGRNLPADGVVPIVDGSFWLEPGWLPPGVVLLSERFDGGRHGGPEPPPGDPSVSRPADSVVLGDSPEGSGVVPRDIVDLSPLPVDVAMDRMVAAGRATTVRDRNGVFVQNRLVWHEDGRWVELVCATSTPSRRGDGCVSDDDLLRIAESLRPYDR